ncbi:glycosyltransferase family 2 protein [Sphingobium phenoxybenzoativorans]|uniref:Glycosyltransferase family 2 protein n=1 Tax=Sphingobium phenoxybenzoativorans TaxID=1592790 RepID=A0A975K3S9_9SPHN|nr:glycosyltransferase family 2 protein [Sphingobium phenoxybenzoativorans]QUT04351.1 glycosyltransferase family 2 protein [Sphingobium phenoxybenzoativorans]
MKRFVIVMWLRGAVLLFAFRRDPAMFLRAMIWRIRGLKVRSRNTLAVLGGQSPQAYRLWIATREPGFPPQQKDDVVEISLLVFVDTQSTQNALKATLQSASNAGATQHILLYDPNGVSSELQASEAGQFKLTVIRDGEALKGALSSLAETWVCPVMAGDRLHRNSLGFYQHAQHEMSLPKWVIYGDDDLVGDEGNRSTPYFKPDWNAELYKFQDYLRFSCILRIDSSCIPGHSIAEPANFVTSMIGLTIDKHATRPTHVAQILHHRQQRIMDVAGAEIGASYRTSSAPVGEKVSIIIPTKNQYKLLKACIDGVFLTDYPNKEIIIIDHESDEQETVEYIRHLETQGVSVMKWRGIFNYSAMNNEAVKLATGSYLCFLNNDIEMTKPDWLSKLMERASRPDIGATGAKLLYPNGTIQHAGVTIGIGGAAGHAHRYCPDTSSGYFNRPHLPQYMMAVTAACMVVKKEKFEKVGGFDEVSFPVAFNDVDLCLKLGEAGWQSFYEPNAVLIHHESISRGSDMLRKNRTRFARELDTLKQKWSTDEVRDPYHNPNLSRLSEQFVIDI